MPGEFEDLSEQGQAITSQHGSSEGKRSGDGKWPTLCPTCVRGVNLVISSTGRTLAFLQGQSVGGFWAKGHSVYGPSRAWRCHVERKLYTCMWSLKIPLPVAHTIWARMHHKIVGNFRSEADVRSLYYRRFRFNETSRHWRMYSRSTDEENSNRVTSSLLRKWTRLPTDAYESSNAYFRSHWQL